MVPFSSNRLRAPLNSKSPMKISDKEMPRQYAEAMAAVAFKMLWNPGMLSSTSPRTFPLWVKRATLDPLSKWIRESWKSFEGFSEPYVTILRSVRETVARRVWIFSSSPQATRNPSGWIESINSLNASVSTSRVAKWSTWSSSRFVIIAPEGL